MKWNRDTHGTCAVCTAQSLKWRSSFAVLCTVGPIRRVLGTWDVSVFGHARVTWQLYLPFFGEVDEVDGIQEQSARLPVGEIAFDNLADAVDAVL